MSGYIGTQPVPQATQTRETFTATASQASFATGGYQAGYIDVFLNGVKLVDGTDFTATNGSDVVLTTGAASGDTLEVVAYTAFEAANVTGATDFTVTGSFTSRGIDDNATSTAMTLDGSGNLLVGKTSANSTIAGVQAISDGRLFATVSNDHTLIGNRLSSDGAIATFQKDGSTVGSIGSIGGVVSYMVLDPRTGGVGLSGTTGSGGAILPTSNAGAVNNGVVSLGEPSYRFKDLYLSGGVYLGGTGAANKLDDYEEGTWTPILSFGSGSIGYNWNLGQYTKVGNQVSVNFALALNSVSSPSGAISLTGLPFASGSGEQYVSAVTFGIIRGLTVDQKTVRGYVGNAQSIAPFTVNATNTGYSGLDANTLTTSTFLYGSIVYQTA